jgi:DDE superfamily endonuclease
MALAGARYGLGALNDYTGDTVVLFRRRKRRRAVAERLQALVYWHPTETIYVAWDNANTHFDDEVEAVVCTAAGRLVLLYLPTDSPWLNPLRGCDGSSAVRSPMVSALSPWTPLSRRRTRAMTGTTSAATVCCRSSGLMLHDFCSCTYILTVRLFFRRFSTLGKYVKSQSFLKLTIRRIFAWLAPWTHPCTVELLSGCMRVLKINEL